MIDRRQLLGAGAFALIPLGPLGAATQVAGVYRHGVGDAVVTVLLDGFIPLDPADLAGADEETKTRLLQQAFLSAGPVETAINAYVIETGGRTIVVDSGAGSAFGDTAGKFAQVLATADIEPNDVDTVVLTHLHPDHCNGLTSNESARFRDAELILHEVEHAFWTDEANFANAGEMAQNFAQMARAAIEPYSDRTTLVQDGAEIAPGVSLMHLPGHTPGHSGLMLTSGDASLLLWADIVHVGPIQFARPEVTIPFDVDQAQAAETRKRVMDMVATDRLMIGGSHIIYPSLGHLERAEEGYRFLQARWDFRL